MGQGPTADERALIGLIPTDGYPAERQDVGTPETAHAAISRVLSHRPTYGPTLGV